MSSTAQTMRTWSMVALAKLSVCAVFAATVKLLTVLAPSRPSTVMVLFDVRFFTHSETMTKLALSLRFSVTVSVAMVREANLMPLLPPSPVQAWKYGWSPVATWLLVTAKVKPLSLKLLGKSGKLVLLKVIVWVAAAAASEHSASSTATAFRMERRMTPPDWRIAPEGATCGI